MQRLLIRNAHVVTMDAERREIADAAILIEDGVIAAVGAVEAAGRRQHRRRGLRRHPGPRQYPPPPLPDA